MVFTQGGHEYKECKECGKPTLTVGYFLMRVSQLRIDLKVSQGDYRMTTEFFNSFVKDVIERIDNVKDKDTDLEE